ncbi:DeoR/GlpR family DNA-binding transcription regulator [Gordonia sp. DT30]|uniref:DeoR/GlpR family DNA-binding transcription regulator n=1 Tax=unclassified Gordonia (in: high G+C Gram-positive bacteria) TaxID=2657482 RepID=UPI003CF74351
MSATERRGQILQRLQIDGYVEAKVLAREMSVDASTIRRDLDALARSGRAERTHGGARPAADGSSEIPYAVKKIARQPEKAAIAAAAAEYVSDGQTVILDSGSTTYQVALALRHRSDLTFITNDLRIAKYVATLPGTRLLVTGGELLGSVFTLVGDAAVGFLANYSADWAFLGADAVDPDTGITNTNTLEVPLKRAMISSARHTVVVADSSKFGNRALSKVASVDEVGTILSDDGLPSDQARRYGEHLVRAPVSA